MANFLIGGPDNVGKGTQINNIKKYLEEQGKLIHYLHYSSIKGDNIYNRSKHYYKQLFNILKFSSTNYINILCDRFYEGEFIYGKIYRNYEDEGSYIYELEKDFGKRVLENSILIIFIADPEILINRDDGKSFSIELDKKIEEINRFKEFFERSKIKYKTLIDITDKNIDEVFNEVLISINNGPIIF